MAVAKPDVEPNAELLVQLEGDGVRDGVIVTDSNPDGVGVADAQTVALDESVGDALAHADALAAPL